MSDQSGLRTVEEIKDRRGLLPLPFHEHGTRWFGVTTLRHPRAERGPRVWTILLRVGKKKTLFETTSLTRAFSSELRGLFKNGLLFDRLHPEGERFTLTLDLEHGEAMQRIENAVLRTSRAHTCGLPEHGDLVYRDPANCEVCRLIAAKPAGRPE